MTERFLFQSKTPGIGIIVLASLLGTVSNATLAQQAGQKKPKVSQAAASASAGRQIFSSVCASCHGLDGRGGERGPDIVTRQDVTRLTDEEMSKILWSGIPEEGMPPFSQLGSSKLSALVSYIRTLQGKGAQAPLPGDPAKGEELFSSKGGCSECHMVNGIGGFLGPELSSYGSNHNATEIHEAIVTPKERAGERFKPVEVTTKDGKNYSGVVRNEDNFSLQLQSMNGTFHFFSKSDLTAINYRKEPLMPTDYGSKLSTAELDALAAYLLQVSHATTKH